MPQTCATCTHSDRDEINRQLAHQEASRRRIAARYGLAETSLRRHARKHLPQSMIEAARAKVSENGTDLLTRVTKLADKLDEALDRAGKYGGDEALYKCARELRPSLELLGKVNGQLVNDRVQALMISWGVSGEDEVKNRLALTSGTDNLSPEEVMDSACEALETLFRKHPQLYPAVMRRLERASIAVEVNGNGHAD